MLKTVALWVLNEKNTISYHSKFMSLIEFTEKDKYLNFCNFLKVKNEQIFIQSCWCKVSRCLNGATTIDQMTKRVMTLKLTILSIGTKLRHSA